VNYQLLSSLRKFAPFQRRVTRKRMITTQKWIIGGMTQMRSDLRKAAEYWSNRGPDIPRTKWWSNQIILRHINRIVCGQQIGGAFAGTAQLLLQKAGALRRGISVGCGDGTKEMDLIAKGIVQSFVLFEISSARVEIGRNKALHRGLSVSVRPIPPWRCTVVRGKFAQ
jgi:hypothetical protein